MGTCPARHRSRIRTASDSQRSSSSTGRTASSPSRSNPARAGAAPVGRDGEGHAPAPHDAAQVEAGVRRIVDRVDEHAPRLRRSRHRAVDLRRRRRHDQPRAVEVGRPELALDPRHVRCFCRLADPCRRDDGDVGPRVEQSAQLRRRDRSGPDHHHTPAAELQEGGVEMHLRQRFSARCRSSRRAARTRSSPDPFDDPLAVQGTKKARRASAPPGLRVVRRVLCLVYVAACNAVRTSAWGSPWGPVQQQQQAQTSGSVFIAVLGVRSL